MIRKIARPMLASVYVADGVDTLVNTDAHVDATDSMLKKLRSVIPQSWGISVPNDPELVARALGGTKVGAGSLLALGKAPRLSAGILAATAIPTILGRYSFWETQDKQERQARQTGFLTHIALLGGLSITALDTEGKPGLRWRAKKARKDVVQALPSKQEASSGLEQASDWISDKADKATELAQQATSTVTEYIDENKDDWKSTAADYAEKAQAGGRELLDQLTSDAKKAKKAVAKKATKAQDRAEKALDKADKSSGRAGKRAQKHAKKLQKKADKAIQKAAKKLK